jgi:hypothetical protein
MRNIFSMFILQLMYLIIRLTIKGIIHFITGLLQQYRLGFIIRIIIIVITMALDMVIR